MNILKKMTVFTVMRMGIAVFLGVFFLAAVSVGVIQGTFMNFAISGQNAEKGVLNLEKYNFGDHMPAYLDGEWEYFPGICYIGDQFDYSRLTAAEKSYVTLPANSIKKSQGPATYRLVLNIKESIQGFSFYLQNYNETFAIYVNGKRVMPVWGGPQEKILYTMSDYVFRIDFPVEPGDVEILISANGSERQSLLYRNQLFFGPENDIIDYVASIWRDDTFLIGMVLILVLVGLVFMLMRMKFDMLSGIALFDTFLAIRILLGFNIASYFIQNVLKGLELGRVEFVAFQYICFFATGAFGCILSQTIFDPKRELPSWPIRVQVGCSIVGGLVTLFLYGRSPGICMVLLLALLIGSFFIVTWHVIDIIQKHKFNSYYLFQIIKTYYIGVIMALDISHLWKGSYNALVYAYVIFFMAHLIARLLDSYASYKEADQLNHNLETLIEDRTKELSEANKCLEELSIRDALTQAYNRLHFEVMIEKALSEYQEDTPGGEIYLCMFDLDYFKNINDRFGHGAGDEQLKLVVNIVNKILGDRGTLSRVGGEEFIILFVNETYEAVQSVIEEIRSQLESDAESNPRHTTASFGLARYHGGLSSKDFLRMADKCLYKAKSKGRNCIIQQ